MVKKLLKHEFTYYFRTFSLFLPIVLVIGVMTKVFRCFDNGNIINDIAIFSSSVMLVMACVALLVLSTVISIIRFYKNMYSAEGYLTFTLPVTTTEHIFVKLFVSTVCQIICLLTVIAAGAIALSGEALTDFFNFMSQLVDGARLTLGAANLIGFVAEVLLLLLLSAISTTLLYYACITVGQTAKKNRILLAIGAYFIYYMATQTISTVLTIVVTVFGTSGVLDTLFDWLTNNLVSAIHIYLCAAIVLYAILSAVFWLVTKIIMTKKLNLE